MDLGGLGRLPSGLKQEDSIGSSAFGAYRVAG